MKKIIIIGITLLSLFGGMQSFKADTLYRTSTISGKVELSLSTTEGYVSAIDTTITLTGKVELQKIIWDSSLSKYTKKYIYDSKNHTVRILLATGSKKNNLVDRDGMIKIGTIVVKSTSEKDETFNISINKLTVANVDYSAVNRENVQNNSEDVFTYTVKPVDNTEEENNKVNQGETNTGNSDTQNQKANNKQKTTNEQSGADKNNTKNVDNQDVIDKQKDTKKKSNKEIIKEKEQSKNNIIYAITISVFILLIVACAIYVRKNNQ